MFFEARNICVNEPMGNFFIFIPEAFTEMIMKKKLYFFSGKKYHFPELHVFGHMTLWYMPSKKLDRYDNSKK